MDPRTIPGATTDPDGLGAKIVDHARKSVENGEITSKTPHQEARSHWYKIALCASVAVGTLGLLAGAFRINSNLEELNGILKDEME